MSKSRAVIDEDLPRIIGEALRELGWRVEDVRDVGLRGKSDAEVIRFARRRKAVLFTGDWGFGNIFQYPPSEEWGIVLLSYPNEVSVSVLARELQKALAQLRTSDIVHNLVIIEPGRIRVRNG